MKISSLLLATTAFALCVGAAPAPAPQAAAPQSAEAPANGPQYGTYGFDKSGMDANTPPGQDFYTYANGAWQQKTEIPADKSRYGMFSVLDDLSKKRTHGILEEAKADANSKIGNAYVSFLDTAAVEKKGLAPIKPWLDQIKAANSVQAYNDLLATAQRNGIDVPFATYVGQDDKNPDAYALNVYQSGLGMPDREYYLSDDPKMVETRNAYLAHLGKMLTLAGEPNAQARAQALLALETKIAQVHWTKVENRDANKTYNKMTVAELATLAPGFGFQRYFQKAGANIDSVIVAQPTAIKGEAALITQANLPALKDALLIRSLDGFAAELPKAFDDEHFAFYGTTLSGQPQQEERWKRAVRFTSDALSDEVSKLYVARYFPPETKAAADKLVKNIIAAMGRRIDQLDWMSPETKAKAHQKLANFTPKIGYPSQWRDFSGLSIKRDDLFGNALRSNQFEYDYNLGKLGKPIYRWEWGMTPMTINAYANPTMVEIVFPAAILQPPFFDPKADDAVNYGGIGAVIGHELSHHFDDQGAKYDVKGRLADWWTPQDVASFKERTDALSQQYDQYEPLQGLHIKGALTLGENIADLAGLTVAHDAYHASLGGKPAPVIDGTTGDQRFYLGWAQVWRTKEREPIQRQLLLTDPHSPGHYRVWTVRNLDPWYGAFKPAEGSEMYLAPNERVRIW